MIAKTISTTIFFFFLNCSTTIEFVPDTDFVNSNNFYTKKSFKEVEIYHNKPNFQIRTEGIVKIRDFSQNINWEYLSMKIQKELYDRKLDGLYFEGKKQNFEVESVIFTAENSAGLLVSYHRQSQEIGYIIGIAFRRVPLNGK
jgi:hypothetical protein